ncbi:MAG: M23 family metallopeptidase [Gemmatimonadota bacterium]|nr:M23 family metallopeptidase [Gemmatimonadota bacterium]
MSRFGTFMFIPHEKHGVRSLQLTRRAAVGLGIALLALVGLVAALGYRAFAPSGDGASPEMVRENVRLKAELERVEGRVATLGQQLENLLRREEELRLAADLPPVPLAVQAVGVGGPGHASFDNPILGDGALNERVGSVSSTLDMLLRRSKLVASSMEGVKSSIASQKKKFEATPSIWPASGFLSSTFSLNRRHPIFHDVRPHYGIDISARRGSPIVSTAAGKVVKAGWEHGHGNFVEIDHGHGVRTTYSHASRILVKRGERVRRGDTIALVGSTGYSVAPHVHYEVHEDGKPVDPLKYVFPDAIAD